MYYGQHSWVVILVPLTLMAVRMLTMRRRRGGRPPGYQRGAQGFAAPGAPTDRTGPVRPAGTSFTGTVPGWFVDPFARHEQRYWSGTGWTEHVLDNGTPNTDPPPPPRRPAD